MPIYEYKIEEGCDFCGERVEFVQHHDEAPLERCPCGARIKRVPSAFGLKRYDRGGDGRLSDANIERHGFARWVKTGDGVWERTAGTDQSGPRHLFKDGSTSD